MLKRTEGEPPPERPIGDIVHERLPRALVPEHDDPRAVALGDDAFERAVLDRVILDVHRQTLVGGIDRGALGHGPREQHAVVFEPEVVVQMTGEMFLDAEEERRTLLALRRLGPRGLGADGEVSLRAIFLQCHTLSTLHFPLGT